MVREEKGEKELKNKLLPKIRVAFDKELAELLKDSKPKLYPTSKQSESSCQIKEYNTASDIKDFNNLNKTKEELFKALDNIIIDIVAKNPENLVKISRALDGIEANQSNPTKTFISLISLIEELEPIKQKALILRSKNVIIQNKLLDNEMSGDYSHECPKCGKHKCFLIGIFSSENIYQCYECDEHFPESAIPKQKE